jgi:cysteine desulfurase / selenocysteine lyase
MINLAIAEAVGFGAACEYLTKIGMHRIYEHEHILGEHLYAQLTTVNGLTLYGPSPSAILSGQRIQRTGLVAFNHNKIHATDMSFFLDQEGVAVRTGKLLLSYILSICDENGRIWIGHHCTQPLHAALGIAGSMRASLYFYNSKQDIDLFIEKLKSTIEMFQSLG